MKLLINILTTLFIILSVNVGEASFKQSDTIKLSLNNIPNLEGNILLKTNMFHLSLQNNLSASNWKDDYSDINESSSKNYGLSVVSEFAGGIIGGIIFGIIGRSAGVTMATCSSDEFFCGIEEIIIGTGLGLAIGSSLGVTIAGDINNKNGSYSSALFGSVSGVLLGFLSVWAIFANDNYSDFKNNLAIVSIISLPAITSTLMFNLYAK